MASTDGLRIGRVSLGVVATAIGSVGIFAAGHAGQLASRIGSLEREVTAISSRHDAEKESTQRQLDHLTVTVDKIWDRLDQ